MSGDDARVVRAEDAFSQRCLDATKPVCIFGIVPPPETVTMEARDKLVKSTANALHELNLDAYVVKFVKKSEAS